MLRLFQTEKDAIRELPKALALDDQAVARALWIDAQDPDEHERELLQRLLNAELPESEDVEEIESSARFFIDNQGLHVTPFSLPRKRAATSPSPSLSSYSAIASSRCARKTWPTSACCACVLATARCTRVPPKSCS